MHHDKDIHHDEDCTHHLAVRLQRLQLQLLLDDRSWRGRSTPLRHDWQLVWWDRLRRQLDVEMMITTITMMIVVMMTRMVVTMIGSWSGGIGSVGN